MRQVIYPVSGPVLSHQERGRATFEPRLELIPWALVFLTVLVWFYAVSVGASLLLVQGFGISILLALGLPMAIRILWYPSEIARPVHVFFLGCIYFFVLDMALLREVEQFPPETILVADTIIVTFLVTAIGTWCLVPFRHSLWTAVLRKAYGNLTGTMYFWMAVIAFSLEYLRRLYFVGWSPSTLVHDLLLARAGGAFRREIAGDWRVFLQPIEVLFWGVTVFADRAWKSEISRLRKFILVVVIVLQLGTFVLDGVRGPLLIAIMLPLFVRAVQHDHTVRQWLGRLVLSSFLLAPVFDLMVNVRGYGWAEIGRVEEVNWNIVQTHRDDNFFWMVNLVDFLQQDRGVLAYKFPLGFIEGIREVGWQFLIVPIPRVFWPDKPLATERVDETRTWNVTDSIVGSLLRYGGIIFVVLGGVLFGRWVKLLELPYLLPKGDGAAISYTFLLVLTAAGTRSLGPGTMMSFFLMFVLIVLGWWTVRAIRQLSRRLVC